MVKTVTVTKSFIDACGRRQKTRRNQRSRRIPLPSRSLKIPRSQGIPRSREILDLSCCLVLSRIEQLVSGDHRRWSTQRASSRNRTLMTQSIQTRTNSAAASHDRYASVMLRRRSCFRGKINQAEMACPMNDTSAYVILTSLLMLWMFHPSGYTYSGQFPASFRVPSSSSSMAESIRKTPWRLHAASASSPTLRVQ